ncbi:hypothetical protein Golax_020404 [Gossypium laxum]|uniref:Uncharacterized protein n=1 Tax=Gossypium laxum TaxID=34288 RepID=A0A7J9B415_9ROSI|nr:hypothetical protein [Gossypium laxum]
MERDEGLRTLKCLRGRLLAERQASKTAKEDAELMGNKVIELEKKLKEETKVMNKAEKRLKLFKSTSVHEDPKVDDTRTSSSSLKASTMEIDMNGRNEKYEDDDYVDNSLALVPLILPETKVAPQIKVVSRSIGEVLDTLRQAKGRIQSSMERRQMIRIGPS